MRVADLLIDPTIRCNESEQRCPLMRLCPCCGFEFVSARNRRQHQHSCPGGMDPVVEAAQHDHLVEVHRVRSRGRARG